MTLDPDWADAVEQAAMVRRGDASPTELVDAAIDRIERIDPALNAVIHRRFDTARAEAAGSLPDGAFRGVPLLVKDLDGSLGGAPLHEGNRLLAEIGHTADHDSHLIGRLRAAGFVVVGKTNTSEFGLVPTAEPVAKGPTRNPWDLDHSPGGSSGGSGAAVAAGLVPVAHAGDGGGSIRIPASHCGLFGLKPSRGRASMGPDVGEAWAGFVVRHVLTRTVRDSAAVLDVIAGPAPGDPYTAPPPARPYREEVGADPGRLRIGLRVEGPGGLAPVDPACAAVAEEAARRLEALGHVVEPAAPPALDDLRMFETFATVMTGNLAATIDALGERAGRPVTLDDVEPLTWAQYEVGRTVTAAQYVAALATAHCWSREVLEWWQGYDVLCTPTCGEPPPRLGDMVSTPDAPFHALERAIPIAMFCAPFNITGQPAASVPLGWSTAGLPIGVQLVADQYREDLLLRLAAQLEAAHPWADRRPPVAA